MLLEALARGLDPPGRAGLGQRPLLPVPRRHGLRRRHRRPGRAAGRRSSATPATRCSCSPRSRPGSATTTTAGPGSRPVPSAPTATRRWSTTSTSASASTRTPTPTSGTRPLNLAPGHHPRHRPGHGVGALARASPPSSAWPARRWPAATTCATAARSTTAPICAALSIEGYGPFPYQVDGDYLGEVTHLEFRHEPEAMALALSPLDASGRVASTPAGDVGHVGDDAVDAEGRRARPCDRDRRPSRRSRPARPRLAAATSRGVDQPVVGVDGHLAAVAQLVHEARRPDRHARSAPRSPAGAGWLARGAAPPGRTSSPATGRVGVGPAHRPVRPGVRPRPRPIWLRPPRGPGSPGSFLISTFTPMPDAGVERLVEGRPPTPAARRRPGRRWPGRQPAGHRGGRSATPSAVRRTSSSTQSAPSSAAWRKASTVFSGRTADAPRWAMTDGRRRI